MLLGLTLVPASAGILFIARRRRKWMLENYGGPRTDDCGQRIRQRHRVEWCTVLAVILLSFAMARPGSNPRPRATQEAGRDIVFVLDVSRSMLAEDIRPSRLGRAKEDIETCLDALKNERVGLVIFAGTAAIRSPLTTDYEFLRMMLRDVSTDSVAHGSTYLQSAFEKVADQVLTDDRGGFQDVILLTDGEDQGGEPERALEAIAGRQARLLVVGYGDPSLGSRIPVTAINLTDTGTPTPLKDESAFLVHRGQEVWTYLKEESLMNLAASAPDGTYARGSASGFLLGPAYRRWAVKAPRRYIEGKGSIQYDELFPWLVAPAILLLLFPGAIAGSREL
jgi:hypothetical protein